MEKRKRGRPPKLVQQVMIEEKPVKVEENVKMATTDINSLEYHIQNNINVKIMTRKISKSGMPTVAGGTNIVEIENDLSKFVSAGYKIVFTMLVDQDAEVITLLHILSKQ